MNFPHVLVPLMFLVLPGSCSDAAGNGPYLATGIKIGEVTQDEAIVWVRLTAHPVRVGQDAPMPDVLYRNDDTGRLEKRKRGRRPDLTPVVTFPEGYDIDTIEGATPGSEGEVRLKYRATGSPGWIQMDWRNVHPQRGYTHQFELSGLSPGTAYELVVEARSLKDQPVTASMEGRFATAPVADTPADVRFIVTTGTSYGDADSEAGYRLYPSALALNPDFFVHTGDIVYYDGLGKTVDLARWHWDRMYSLPNHIEFHRQVPSYLMKDDHDTWMNDAFPGLETRFMGAFTYDQGTQLFLDQVPMGEKTYRTIRWGRDLQVWLVEGRDYRSANTMEDGPEKTIWGPRQMDWFRSTVEQSDATFKILISPTPIVGPDRSGNKNDNHANETFSYEGDRLRTFISKQPNMVTVCGDRHWQYVSKDAETGVLEFSCGPGSDSHAGGWSQDNKLPEHIYLNVVGGFLEAAVSPVDGVPTLVFRHHNPNGAILHEYTFKAQ